MERVYPETHPDKRVFHYCNSKVPGVRWEEGVALKSARRHGS